MTPDLPPLISPVLSFLFGLHHISRSQRKKQPICLGSKAPAHFASTNSSQLGPEAGGSRWAHREEAGAMPLLFRGGGHSHPVLGLAPMVLPSDLDLECGGAGGWSLGQQTDNSPSAH